MEVLQFIGVLILIALACGLLYAAGAAIWVCWPVLLGVVLGGGACVDGNDNAGVILFLASLVGEVFWVFGFLARDTVHGSGAYPKGTTFNDKGEPTGHIKLDED